MACTPACGFGFQTLRKRGKRCIKYRKWLMRNSVKPGNGPNVQVEEGIWQKGSIMHPSLRFDKFKRFPRGLVNNAHQNMSCTGCILYSLYAIHSSTVEVQYDQKKFNSIQKFLEELYQIVHAIKSTRLLPPTERNKEKLNTTRPSNPER